MDHTDNISKPKSKKSHADHSNEVNYSLTEDIKIFVQFTPSNPETRNLFFEENREVIYTSNIKLNIASIQSPVIRRSSDIDSTARPYETGVKCRKYRFDYVFSEYETTYIISNAIKSHIYVSLKAEKNLSFYSFGDKYKSKFLFGYRNVFTYESFFKQSFDFIISMSKAEDRFDIILIDYYKTCNEKYIVDHVSSSNLEKFTI